MNKKIIGYVVALILVVLLMLNFGSNFIKDNTIDFKNFQSDSEYLVFSKIFEDKYGFDNKYGLSIIYTKDNNDNVTRFNSMSEKITNYDETKDSIILKEYTSQVGLQGYIFSFLYNKLHMPFWFLKLICCALLSIIIVAICYLISKKYNYLMGAIFYITFLLSPWIVSFARNLYWVEFTWFLPGLLGLLISMNYSKRKILLPCIFLSILVKCLCGYEYITTIMLFTISFFIIDFFVTKDTSKRKEIFKTTIMVGLCCLLAFLVALLIHSIMRGNGNILNGFKAIYKYDIQRRTFISPNDTSIFGKHVQSTLDATIISVVSKYFTWKTDIILGVQGQFFVPICLITLAILICSVLIKEKHAYRDITMLIIFLINTLSWFILGKAHSFEHTHMNYVLWYFGFKQICFYIIVNFIWIILKRLKKIKHE